MNEITTWGQGQFERLRRKYKDHQSTTYILQRRTYNTAYAVVERLQGVPLYDLVLHISALNADGYDYTDFIKKYEGKLVEATYDRDKFIRELDKFYREMATYISRNYCYGLFYAFLAWISDVVNTGFTENQNKVFYAYMDLIMQQVQYLRPDKNDINQIIIGVDSNGTGLITGKDPFPNFDVAIAQLEDTGDFRVFSRYGYRIANRQDMEFVQAGALLYDNNITLLAGYINEYTTDIVPENPFDVGVFELPESKELPQIKDALTKRRRTLPANGLVVKFEGSTLNEEILLKEILRDEKISVLFRLRTNHGDVSGRYDTKTQIIHTPFSNSGSRQEIVDYIERIVLWSYASYVTDKFLPDTYQEYFVDPAEVKLIGIGGKLRKPGEAGNGQKIAGKEPYEAELKTINGFIRKLPVGKNASEQAQNLAASLGFELAPNETYVRPFIRQQWILKRQN